MDIVQLCPSLPVRANLLAVAHDARAFWTATFSFSPFCFTNDSSARATKAWSQKQTALGLRVDRAETYCLNLPNDGHHASTYVLMITFMTAGNGELNSFQTTSLMIIRCPFGTCSVASKSHLLRMHVRKVSTYAPSPGFLWDKAIIITVNHVGIVELTLSMIECLVLQSQLAQASPVLLASRLTPPLSAPAPSRSFEFAKVPQLCSIRPQVGRERKGPGAENTAWACT